MSERAMSGRTGNALAGELEVKLSERCEVSAEAVYEVLTDLQSHLEWGGRRNPKNFRLLSMEAPEGPASVGTEFVTIGGDSMGTFHDRSVVTQADRPKVFEFVTEGTLETKRGGKRPEWTVVHRYEISPEQAGSRVGYAIRITRITELPGMLAILRVPVLRGIGLKVSASNARKGLRNLVKLAEERAA